VWGISLISLGLSVGIFLAISRRNEAMKDLRAREGGLYLSLYHDALIQVVFATIINNMVSLLIDARFPSMSFAPALDLII
jgi:hypothetical protein